MFELMSLLLSFQTVVAPAPKTVAFSPARLTDATEVVSRVQNYYEDTQKLKSHFRQVYTNSVFGKKSQSQGVVMVQKPGRMRWDYKRPEARHFISDGKTLWAYEPANKQVFKKDLKDQLLPVAVTFLYGEGNLDRDFTATLDKKAPYGRKQDYVVKLTPKQPSAQYKNLWLVVDPDDFHVRESVIREATDNTNHFTFYNIRLNDRAKFAAKHFEFTPPPGVKVIDPSARPAGR